MTCQISLLRSNRNEGGKPQLEADANATLFSTLQHAECLHYQLASSRAHLQRVYTMNSDIMKCLTRRCHGLIRRKLTLLTPVRAELTSLRRGRQPGELSSKMGCGLADFRERCRQMWAYDNDAR